jgi:hypothetical protein
MTYNIKIVSACSNKSKNQKCTNGPKKHEEAVVQISMDAECPLQMISYSGNNRIAGGFNPQKHNPFKGEHHLYHDLT